MTIAEALQEGWARLAQAGIVLPELDAEILLRTVLGKTKEELLMHPEKKLSDRSIKQYGTLLNRRSKREPVAYLTGTKEFYGRPFAVSRDVLIPRPESELLIETFLEMFERSAAITLADVGTGSGCLAITLALELPNASLIATDVSENALVMARQNAKTHGVASRITFVHGNLLEPIKRRTVDGVVANLPYVPDAELTTNPDLAYEPVLALRGAHHPTTTYQTFLDHWYSREQRPLVLMEIHPNLRAMLEKENDKVGVHIGFLKDLAGHDRVAVLKNTIGER